MDRRNALEDVAPALSAPWTGELVLGTANPHKAAELAALLVPISAKLLTLADLDGALSIDEQGPSLAHIARQKATLQARHLRRWVLADDTGLFVDALDGTPGVYTARFAGPAADAKANRAKLLASLADVPPARRTARFVCHLALADPQGTLRAEAEGCCHGRIRTAEAGAGGFGYDALFELIEYHRTYAELGVVALSRLNHRARAVERLLAAVESLPSA